MSAQLSVAITTASGEVYRWGPDEWNAMNIPQAITFGTSMPGGFKSATITLPRRIDREYPDLNLLDNVEILGPGNVVVWEGRVQQLPRSHQDSFSIQVGAVGWSAHLMDDTSFREIYIDIDLGKWGDPSIARKLQLIGAGFVLSANASAGWSGSTNEQALTFDFSSVQATASANEMAELWYYGNGVDIGQILFDQVGDATTTWDKSLALGSNETMTPAADISPNYSGIAESNGQGLTATEAGRKYARARAAFTGAFTGQMVNVQRYRNIKVLGRHGLTLQGGVGLLASDVLADCIARGAPLLNFTTGASGSIQPTDFPIPHLCFPESTAVQAIIMAVNGYHLWDWGVWEAKQFFFKEPGPERLTWEARLSDGARLDLEGTQVDDVYNGVWVTYTDPGGKTHTAGPPGSGADATDPSLVDTSATNPVNAHGIPKKWAPLNISQTTTQAGAIQLGAIYLGEKSLPQRRGSLTLTGTVTHPTAGKCSVRDVRAGDWVRIGDHPTDLPRKVIETNYDANTDAITCSLDNASQKVDAILERLGVSLMGVN